MADFSFFVLFLLIFFTLSFAYLEINNKKIAKGNFDTPETKLLYIKIISNASGYFNSVYYRGEILGTKENLTDPLIRETNNYDLRIYCQANNLLKKNDIIILKIKNPQSIKEKNEKLFYNLNSEDLYGFQRKASPGHFSHINSFLIKYLRKVLTGINSGFVFASLTGEKKYLNSVIYKLYTDTGTSHIMALSGLHLGIILAVFYFFGKIFPLRKTFIYFTALLFSLLYIYIENTPLSLVRAFIMLALAFPVLLMHRKISGEKYIPLVFFTGFLFLRENVFSLSFVLSISAIFSIFYLYPLIIAFMKKYLYFKDNIIVQAFVLSLSISILQIPLSLFFFSGFNPFSWLINPIIIFIFTLVVYCIIIYIPLFIIIPQSANFLSLFFNFLLNIQHLILFHYRSAVPYCSFSITPQWKFAFLSFFVGAVICIFVLYFFKLKWKEYGKSLLK